MKASTATPPPTFSFDAAGFADHSSTTNLRTSPETAIESGAICVPVEPVVCTPDHLGNESWKPAVPSGAPESRCGGRIAATASSKPTTSDLNALEMRSCVVRL